MPNINVIVDENTKAKIEFLVKLNNSVVKPPKKKKDGISQISIINELLEEYFARDDNAEYLRLFEERGEFGAMLEIQETLRKAENSVQSIQTRSVDNPAQVKTATKIKPTETVLSPFEEKSGGGRNE